MQQTKILQLGIENCSASKEILPTRTFHHELVLIKGPKVAEKLAGLVENKALSANSTLPSGKYAVVLGEMSGKVLVESARKIANYSIQ